MTFAACGGTPEPILLTELRRATWQRTRHGRLMTDPHTGRVLATVSRMLRPSIILELGTFTGYGTLCLLEGLAGNGVLHTVERNDELFALQDGFWARAEGGRRIRRHHADAMEVLHSWEVDREGRIDLAYVDADKQGVNAQLDALLPRMAEGGWILFDNTWWGGTLDEAEGPKPDALRALNTRLAEDDRLHAVVLPVGDGLTAVQQI